MASQMRELKSILKPSRSSHAPEVKSREEQERIALAHARIIQQQKETELQILDAIEKLSTFPLSTDPTYSSAASPSPSDAETFTRLIRPFQPGDYDDLIEERNITGRCGYVLCGRRKREMPGRWTLVNHNRPDFAIVETKDLGRWCSDMCARRALYVKVQLNETAAWERVAMPDVRVELMDEPGDGKPGDDGTGSRKEKEKEKESEDDKLARDVADLRLSEERKAKSVSAALSLERGDVLERGEEGKKRKVPLAPKMELTIREKEVKSVAQPPMLEPGDGEQGVEGHVPRFGNRDDDDSGFEGSDQD